LDDVLRHTVDLDAHHTTTHAQRVLDFDPVNRASAAVNDLKLAPPARHARIDLESILLQLESQYRLQPRTIHPTRRSRVPRPATTTIVRRHRINVTDRNV